MSDESARFDQVEDRTFQDSGPSYRYAIRPLAVVLGYLLLFGGVVQGYRGGEEGVLVVAGREVGLLDWVTGFALFVLAVVVVPRLVRHPGAAAGFLREFARDRLAAVGLGVLTLLVAVATVGPLLTGPPEVDPLAIYQPPVGFSVQEYVPVSCLGEVSGGRCHGTLEYPLGTTQGGHDLVATVVYGLRTSLQVGVSAAVITAGIGTTVGVVAGSLGGRVDGLLMRYVDVQSAVPAFFAYVLVVAIFSQDLVLMVVVFGLLSWGGLARLVRSEVIRIRDEPYMRAATAAGAGSLHRIRHHVLPNVGTAALVPVTTLVPLYVLYEAALTYLGFGESDIRVISLGAEVDNGLSHQFSQWWEVWWQPVVPALALTLLVCSILVVGDRVRAVADPRQH